MKKDLLAVTIVLIIITIAMTFPLILRMNTCIPAFFSTDETFGTLWDYWRIKSSIKDGLSMNFTDLIAYPYGFDMHKTGTFYYLHESIRSILAHTVTPAFAYNIQIIVNFILAGLFVYLLSFYMTGVRSASLFSALIFAFSPYQFVRGWQHLSLTYTEFIPLCLLAFIILKERDSRRNILFAVVSILLLFSFDYSIMYATVIAVAAFIVYALCYGWKKKVSGEINFFTEDLPYIKGIAIVTLVTLVILLPQLRSVFSNMLVTPDNSSFVSRTYVKNFNDLFAQSARPLSYFLPAIVHPFFGGFTEQFIGSSLYGVSLTEHTLYLGWMPLILAFVAFKRWRRRRKGEVASEGDCPSRFYTGFFVFLAIVAWFFSQPPWWNLFGFKLYMPSFFMYKILPMFRAYCRFGVVLMLAVAVLAGFGLNFILERFRSNKTKIAITALVCGLVLFEFWNWPPYKVIDVSKAPSVYYWLKGQPGDFAISEYPSDADSPNEMYKFYQTKHEKKITNGTIPGTYANKVSQAIRNLSDSATPGTLKWMGVKYVLVHRDDYLKSELLVEIEELNKIPKNRGLKFIRSFPAEECPDKGIMCVQKSGPVDIYEVVAGPVEPEL